MLAAVLRGFNGRYLFSINEPALKILTLMAYASNEGSAKTAHMRSLARAFVVRTLEVRKTTKILAKPEIPTFTPTE